MIGLKLQLQLGKPTRRNILHAAFNRDLFAVSASGDLILRTFIVLR